ncbi:ATP-binding protein [Streptomyces sp. NPDC048254]|uniref:ATP-binding protein n=1 Tax=Streptomyces sp. NPDC048254 TaxID=3365525 RepID=UPI00370F867C
MLPRTVDSSPAARLFVRKVLRDWGLDDVEDDAGLVVTELVTNAIQHTSTPTVRVTVRRMSPQQVRVTVTDKGRGRVPRLRRAGPSDTSGRGLLLVSELSHAWGYSKVPWSKYVWADLVAGDEK